MTTSRSATCGLTLVEVLVALAVFSIIGIAAFAMLDQTIRSERQVGARLARLADVQRAMQVLTIDTMQAISGSVAKSQTGLSFLRRGTVGVNGRVSAEGIAVRYHLDKQDFIREIGPQGAPPTPQILLNGVKAATWKIIEKPDTTHTEISGLELILQLASNEMLRGVYPLPYDEIRPVKP